MIYFLKRSLPFLLLFLACRDINDKTAEEIINKSIEISGFNTNEIDITFDFRAYHYESVSYTHQTLPTMVQV